MNIPHAFLWGFISTILLTTVINVCRGFGFTRLNLALVLGTLFTANRDRAQWTGFLLHLVMGWAIAFIYVAAFTSTGMKSWWLGMAMGFLHAIFILFVLFIILPYFHPRMASEKRGPDPTRQLEPPGFLGINYGKLTPLTIISSHLVYGLTIALFYKP